MSYQTSERDINHATTPNINTSLPQLVNLSSPLKASLGYAVLGENLMLPGAAVTTVVSFGQPKDGFYRVDNYITWCVSLSISYGSLPLSFNNFLPYESSCYFLG